MKGGLADGIPASAIFRYRGGRNKEIDAAQPARWSSVLCLSVNGKVYGGTLFIFGASGVH